MANIRNWRVILASATAFVLLVVASAAGFWQSGNQMFSDWLFDMGAISLDREPAVLLVEHPEKRPEPQALNRLIGELDRLGARHTVVLPGALTTAAENLPASLSERVIVSKFPDETASPEGGPWMVAPRFEAGYFRYIDKSDESTPTPWFRDLMGEAAPASERLYLNFGFLRNGLPIVSQQQVLAGEVIPEVVSGRVVLLGPTRSNLTPGFPVPGTEEHLSALKIQGLAWATAEADAGLHLPQPLWQVTFILVLFLVNLLVFQWLSPVFGAVFSLVSVILVGIAGWLSVQVFQTLLPVLDLTVVQLASLLFVYQARRATEDRTVTEMLDTTNAALFERYIPEAFNESASPWPKLVVFIRQQLNLERSILLERVPGDHRVREIESINCSIDDIGERRRDYERVPYSDALQRRKPLQLKRPYFESTDDEELEYLTPLMFAGEVLGFWALTVRPDDSWSREAFESNIASFALQIGELLYHRQQLAREKQRERRLGRRILALEVGRNHPERLRSALELLGNRMASLEAVYDSLKTGAIMYDLFGQVLQANARALDIAGQANLAVYQLTALDFLSALCGLTQDNARRQLRHVTLKRAEVRLPVRAVASNKELMLAIRPISTAQNSLDAIRVANSAQPFKLLGLSFEITDTSHAGAALERRDDLLQQLILYLRNLVSRVTLAAHLTAPDLESGTSGERLLGEINQFSSRFEAAVADIERQVAVSEESTGLKSAEPINLLRAVNKTLNQKEQSIRQKRLTVLRDLPYVVSLVGAVADELSALMDRVLDLLVSDASPGSQLQVSVKERSEPDSVVSLTLSNVGYGLPQRTLDRILAKPVAELLASDDPIEETLGTVKSMSEWGGQAEITADVGKGYSLHLHFKPLAFSKPQGEQTTLSWQEKGYADE